jgi:hypothetical protein
MKARKMLAANKYRVQAALAVAAGVIGASGHDGWGRCLFLILMVD